MKGVPLQVKCTILGFFFLKRGQKLCPISIKIEGVYKKFKRFYTQAYSPGINSPNRFALAIAQSLASHLILSNITNVGESLCLKTPVFLSSHIIHTVSKVREANPFR
jgi:hypothetical protein